MTDEVPPVVEAVETAISRAESAAVELEEWFTRHIHDSAISVRTDLFNEAHAAKQRLKEFLQHLDA